MIPAAPTTAEHLNPDRPGNMMSKMTTSGLDPLPELHSLTAVAGPVDLISGPSEVSLSTSAIVASSSTTRTRAAMIISLGSGDCGGYIARQRS